MPGTGQIFPYVLPWRWERQTVVLAGIQITLLVRLTARVSNRSLALLPSCPHSTLFHVQWCACGAWLIVGEFGNEHPSKL